MKIIDIVKFNQGVAYVVDEIGEKLYEWLPIGGRRYIYGTDSNGVLYACFRYDSPSEGWKAFGGRKFDLAMKDGTVEHCYGQWWDGGSSAIAKGLGIELVPVVIDTITELEKCFVFTGEYADKTKMDALVEAFNAEHADYSIWEYKEYEKYVKGKRNKEAQDAESD